MTSLGPSSNLCVTCHINPKEKFGNCTQCWEKLIRQVKCLTCNAPYNLTDKGTTVSHCKVCTYKIRSNKITVIKGDLHSLAEVHAKPSVPLMLKCLNCNEDYDVRAEGTRASTCKACTEESFKAKLSVKEIKNEIILLKKEIEEDKDLLTSEDIKLYSDTKQVWWVRVIKWILKYI